MKRGQRKKKKKKDITDLINSLLSYSKSLCLDSVESSFVERQPQKICETFVHFVLVLLGLYTLSYMIFFLSSSLSKTGAYIFKKGFLLYRYPESAVQFFFLLTLQCKFYPITGLLKVQSRQKLRDCCNCN